MKIASKNILSLGLFLILGLSVNGCVTTRSQLNDSKGITSDDDSESGAYPFKKNSVKSKPIQEEKVDPAPAATTFPTANKPTMASEPATEPPKQTQSGPAPTMGAAITGEYGMEELRAAVAKLSGQVEQLEHDKQANDTQTAEERKKLQDKIDALEKEVKPPGPTLPEGKDPFEAGKDSFAANNYTDAVAFMDQYLQSEKPKKADEAFYIRGESNFKLKNYKQAIVDLSKFPEKYQKSVYHPKALLGIAESFEAMGMGDDSKAFYSDLAEKFPKTAEGKLAKKRLRKK